MGGGPSVLDNEVTAIRVGSMGNSNSVGNTDNRSNKGNKGNMGNMGYRGNQDNWGDKGPRGAAYQGSAGRGSEYKVPPERSPSSSWGNISSLLASKGEDEPVDR